MRSNEVVDANRLSDEEIEQRGAWLGGLFEAGGHIGFFINHLRRKTFQSYPQLKMSDNHEGTLDKLEQQLGGSKYKVKGTGSWVWMARGTKGRVPVLANAMMPYTPSRLEVILAIQNWEQADLDERVQIARDLKGNNRLNTVKVDDYFDLVKRPDFVAGVFDGRATLYLSRHRDEEASTGFWTSQLLNVHSGNVPLLEALQVEYGGSIFEGSNNGNTWQLGKRATSELLPAIQDHLLLAQVKEGKLSRS